jgi:hypothetical protein
MRSEAACCLAMAEHIFVMGASIGNPDHPIGDFDHPQPRSEPPRISGTKIGEPVQADS